VADVGVPEARERARRLLNQPGHPDVHVLARDVLALADENERLQAQLEGIPMVEDALARAERAVAETATLRQALEEIADVNRFRREPPDWRLGFEIARAALAGPPTQEPA
jgi:hypothetical protein